MASKTQAKKLLEKILWLKQKPTRTDVEIRHLNDAIIAARRYHASDLKLTYEHKINWYRRDKAIFYVLHLFKGLSDNDYKQTEFSRRAVRSTKSELVKELRLNLKLRDEKIRRKIRRGGWTCYGHSYQKMLVSDFSYCFTLPQRLRLFKQEKEHVRRMTEYVSGMVRAKNL